MFNIKLFSVLLINIFVGKSHEECPMLVSDFSQDDCTSRSADGLNGDSFYYYLDDNSCIPKCRNYKNDLYKNCTLDKKCMPGYTCQRRCGGPDDDLKQISCENDSDCIALNGTNCDFYCVAENKESCMAYHINTSDYNTTYWTALKFKPSCNKDGTWKAKQCKGGVNGRCMCFDAQGNRIFGQAQFADSANMTCACSRRLAETQTKRNVTFHCDSMGNYEPLQCDQISSQCWCVESQTGELISAVVPEKAKKLLPCYSEDTYGSQYLRQCESKLFAQTRIKAKLQMHGVTYVSQDFLLCDKDGSYGAFTIQQDNAYCTWRNNTKISIWQANIQSGYEDLNCNCARDYYVYAHAQICLPTGNYKPLQHDITNYYCVDKDGFATTQIFTDPGTNEDSYCDQFY